MVVIKYSQDSRPDRLLTLINILIGFAVFTLIIISIQKSHILTRLKSTDKYDLEWTLEDGTPCTLFKFKSDRRNIPESHFIYKTVSSCDTDKTLIFRSRNLFIKGYLNGKLFYAEDTEIDKFFGSARGSDWHVMTIPAHSDSYTLSIECISVYDNTYGIIDNIYFDSLHNVLEKVISTHIIGFIVSIILMFISVALICIYIFLNFKRLSDKSLLYLGITVFFASLWSNMETMLWPLFGGTGEMSHIISYISLSIIPIFLSLIGYEKLKGLQKFFCKICYFICVLNFIVITFLHFSGILEYHYTLYFTYILIFLIILITFMIAINYIRAHKNEKSSRVLIVGVSLVSFSAIYEIIRYICGSYGSYPAVTRIGFLIIVICLAIIYSSKFIDILRTNAQAEMLHQIAMTDNMTTLYNRTALSEDTPVINNMLSLHKTIGVLQFDVNNLKPVNDLFGHEQGDKLIIAAANCIKKSFSEYGKCYRIGGDEFLVIFSGNDPVSDYERGMNLFEKERALHNENVGKETQLNIAHGFIAGSDMSLKELINSADSLMYENKRNYKKQIL